MSIYLIIIIIGACFLALILWGSGPKSEPFPKARYLFITGQNPPGNAGQRRKARRHGWTPTSQYSDA